MERHASTSKCLPSKNKEDYEIQILFFIHIFDLSVLDCYSL